MIVWFITFIWSGLPVVSVRRAHLTWQRTNIIDDAGQLEETVKEMGLEELQTIQKIKYGSRKKRFVELSDKT